MGNALLPAGYGPWLEAIKRRITGERARAALAVNAAMIRLYHAIGTEILERIQTDGWGAKVIDRLAADLKEAFPDMAGLSATNLKYMRIFAERCPGLQFGQQAVDQLPWGHLIALLTQLDDNATRAWYAAQVLAEGWNRGVLEAAIRDRRHLAMGAAPTNFPAHLPDGYAAAAQAVLKDPYQLGFLGVGAGARERAIEDAMLARVEALLMEFGRGFAFVGRQVDLDVGGEEFRVDLLLYHLHLHAYLVVELKAEAFHPRDTGQLGFYVEAVDRQFRRTGDAPTIGLLLCPAKNDAVVEVALASAKAAMGVATYTLGQPLPPALAAALPSREELTAAITTDVGEVP